MAKANPINLDVTPEAAPEAVTAPAPNTADLLARIADLEAKLAASPKVHRSPDVSKASKARKFTLADGTVREDL